VVDPQLKASTRPVYTTLAIIGAAIGVSIIVMAIIAVVLADSVAAPSTEDGAGMLLPIFLVLSVAAIVAAVVVRRHMMASVAAASGLDQGLGRLRLGTVLACAFSEVPAILGLVYVLVSGDLMWAPLFFGGSLVSLAFSFPRLSQWESVLSIGPQGVAPTIRS